MRSRGRRVALVALASTLSSLGCRDRSLANARSFEVHDAWVRAAVDTGATTAGYVRLINGTAADVTVSSFASDAARSVELHRSWTDAEKAMHMTMQPSVTIAAHAPLVMKPGGYHLMLIGTMRVLKDGDPLRITMRLSTGAIVSTMARVRAQ